MSSNQRRSGGGVRRLARKLREQLQRLALPSALRGVGRTQGMISFAEARLLYDLARQVTAGCIVEVGSYRGRSSVALAAGSRDGSQVPVYAVDPHEPFEGALGGQFGPEDRAAFYRAMLRTRAYRHVRLINLSSEVVAPGWKLPVGLLWIDGDHTLAGVQRDLEAWEPHLLPGAIVAFDDSLDPALGPSQLIARLTGSGRYLPGTVVGKVTTLRPASSGAPAHPR